MTSPGTYMNVPIVYTDASRFLRGRPLLSAPVFDYPVGEKRVLRVTFLAPRRRGKRGPFSSRVKINGTTFSLAVIAPTKGDPYLDAMFEDAEGFSIDAGSGDALFFLKVDTAVRNGETKALELLAAIEVGIFVHRLAMAMAARANPSIPSPASTA